MLHPTSKQHPNPPVLQLSCARLQRHGLAASSADRDEVLGVELQSSTFRAARVRSAPRPAATGVLPQLHAVLRTTRGLEPGGIVSWYSAGHLTSAGEEVCVQGGGVRVPVGNQVDVTPHKLLCHAVHSQHLLAAGVE